jgi:hypothetical protein
MLGESLPEHQIKPSVGCCLLSEVWIALSVSEIEASPLRSIRSVAGRD